ncbi:hypothetical protein LCI18_012846 [Fusarium solani-melongenae]|uniref:Uncharacterized protein n=1 Tax=Fusarium solani subsp. cucurbitae TaxID=2747967 RepID=A0ACD3ZLD4_FUSSC|nr:hypothetical protein LCI18_012846 [Fusarium solani-melongenae]
MAEAARNRLGAQKADTLSSVLIAVTSIRDCNDSCRVLVRHAACDVPRRPPTRHLRSLASDVTDRRAPLLYCRPSLHERNLLPQFPALSQVSSASCARSFGAANIHQCLFRRQGEIPSYRRKLTSEHLRVSRPGATRDWSVYFNGCLMIFESGHQTFNSYEGDAGTLLDWVLYYNIFYKLGITHWAHRTERQEIIANRGMVLGLASTHPRRHTIQSTLGCSLELLGLLNEAIDLLPRRNGSEGNQGQQQAINRLHHKIQHVDQQLCSGIDIEDYHGPGSRKHYTVVARIFQLAVVIYLDRVVQGSTIDSIVSRNAAREAFGLLQDIGVCERPFPMFILSFQAAEEQDRVIILKALQNSKTKRALSNLDLTKEIIQRLWSQQDLHGTSERDALELINIIFSSYLAPPCLA